MLHKRVMSLSLSLPPHAQRGKLLLTFILTLVYRKVARYLYEKFQDRRRQKRDVSMNVTQVLKGKSRQESARLFYEILVHPLFLFGVTFKLTKFLSSFLFRLLFSSSIHMSCVGMISHLVFN